MCRFRQKYPNIVTGAIAASAPVLQFTGLTDPGVYNEIVTATFRAANPVAAGAIWNSWGVMSQLAETQSGRDSVREWLGICDELNSPSDVTQTVFNWLNNAQGYMCMADYPYPSNFLGPLPGWPVAVATANITDPNAPPESLLTQVRGIPQIFYNYTGQAGACFNLSSLMPPGLAGDGWNVQSCNEMVMPIGQYGWPSDMFWVAPWSLPATVAGCQQTYGTTPRPAQVSTLYGGLDLRGASNIVFSNGNLDPWSGGGVTPGRAGLQLGPGVVAVMIEQGAHHLDLRASNPADPPSVVAARKLEADNIEAWIGAFYAAGGQPDRKLRVPGTLLPWE